MSPLPPDTVLIKRKRTAEPVDSLRVQESAGKRQRRAAFVYQLQPTSEALDQLSSRDPTIKQTRQPFLPNPFPSKFHAPAASTLERDAYNSGTNTPGDVTPPLPTGAATPIPRPIARPPPRFHITRSSATPSALDPSVINRKRRSEFIFSERKGRSRNSEGLNAQPATSQTDSQPQTRPQKKPGLAKYARTSTLTAKPKQDIPLPLRNVNGMPWDVNSEELVAQMQAYTLQEIGRNIAASEAERPAPKASTSTRLQNAGPSKFKPKKPSLRYAERHPEEVAAGAMDVDGIEEDYIEEDSEDESDYIIDTYVRVPAEALESVEEQSSFGFLVLDSQPDIDAFYREDTDSDDEAEDEDEDENAENHYTADYPDEEIDSDDEYGRNAYHYSKDADEFDDCAFSDDDEHETTKYPWMNVKKPKKLENEDEDDEDE